MPKSMILTRPSSSTRMLPGLMSRWMTPCSWAEDRPRRSAPGVQLALEIHRLAPLDLVVEVLAGQVLLDQVGHPVLEPKSWTVVMLRCSRLPAISASVKKRCADLLVLGGAGLDRHPPLDERIAALVDHPEAADPDLADEFVFAGFFHGARRKGILPGTVAPASRPRTWILTCACAHIPPSRNAVMADGVVAFLPKVRCLTASESSDGPGRPISAGFATFIRGFGLHSRRSRQSSSDWRWSWAMKHARFRRFRSPVSSGHPTAPPGHRHIGAHIRPGSAGPSPRQGKPARPIRRAFVIPSDPSPGSSKRLHGECTCHVIASPNSQQHHASRKRRTSWVGRTLVRRSSVFSLLL